MTDIEIARSVEPKRIAEIAEKAGLDPEKIEPYGRYKAKIDPKLVSGEPGKLILVTAINPTPAGEAVTCKDIHAQGAMAALLKDALMPNLVQTLEGTPALVHGGPFANIAHGCNSVIATRTALKMGDYCVTEAGFGADLGAEKFLDIKCRMAGLAPSAVVIVATVRALKSHGGVPKAELEKENLEALEKGIGNLLKHVENMQKVYSMPVVVALNRFESDTQAELDLVEEKLRALGVNVRLCDVWAKGGQGGLALAEEVLHLCEQPSELTYAYPLEETLENKIAMIAKRVYGAKNVSFAAGIRTQLRKLDKLGNFPVCMAKTQYSLSDDPKKTGRPEDFTITVRLSAGAGFVVAFTGEIIAMPGLPKVPAAEAIDVDENGEIVGLF